MGNSIHFYCTSISLPLRLSRSITVQRSAACFAIYFMASNPSVYVELYVSVTRGITSRQSTRNRPKPALSTVKIYLAARSIGHPELALIIANIFWLRHLDYTYYLAQPKPDSVPHWANVIGWLGRGPTVNIARIQGGN